MTALEGYEVELARRPAEAAEAIARAAEEWGGEWTATAEGGRLALPVVFGLRRGAAVGRVEIVGLGSARARVTWTLEESHLEVHRGSVAVLSIAAVPALGALAWPFWPPLLALAPLAAVLGFLAWWLVVARLRSSGPEEFFSSLEPPE
jgi:hypothetical protein